MPSRLKVLERAILIGLAVWLGFNWFRLITTVVHDYSALPNWDYWRVVSDYDDLKALHLSVFWKQHNDHRIIFPELVFGFDMLASHGLQIIPLAVSFICYAGTWAVLAWVLLAERSIRLPARAIPVLLIGILMGWRGASGVLAMPFLLQWTMLQVAVVAALTMLAHVRPGKDAAFLAGSISCAIVANYTAGNGLFLWVLLIAIAFWLRLSRRQIAVLSLTAVASIAIFFIHYKSGGTLSLLNPIRYPIYWSKFVTSYLSVPFGLMGHWFVGVIFGSVSLVVFALSVRAALRHGMLRSPAAIVLFGTYVFTLVSGLLVSFGRMDPTDGAFIAAKASRYVILPLVNWAALLAAAFWVTYRIGRAKLAFTIAGAACILFAKMFSGTDFWVRDRDFEFSEQQIASLSLESGLRDQEFLRRVYPDIHFIDIYLPVLKKNRLSIYYYPYADWLKKHAGSIVTNLPARPVPGDVTQVHPVHGGLQVMGWSDAVHRASYLPKVVFINDQGLIAGFGRKLPAGYPPYLPSTKTPAQIAWTGFVQSVPGSKSFHAFVLDRRSRTVVSLGDEMLAPDISAASQEEIGDIIKGARWDTEGSWGSNLTPPGVDPGVAPSKFLSSWLGGDQNRASMRTDEIPAPADHCLVLPIMHGPVVSGVSASVLDATTGQKLIEMPMQGSDTQWRYWQFRLDQAVNHFEIEVTDAGHEWGEWIAAGDPHLCR